MNFFKLLKSFGEPLNQKKVNETENIFLFFNHLLEKYKKSTVEEIVLDETISELEKRKLLEEIHKFSPEEALELTKEANKAKKEAKLKKFKRNIIQRAQELYNDIPVGDIRIQISDEVKSFVWNRDGGKCVRCGSRENLEFDHIIPISKGGSNTARNIELLCEKCNREKSNNL